MTNSVRDISDNFADKKDEYFSQLIRTPEFWHAYSLLQDRYCTTCHEKNTMPNSPDDLQEMANTMAGTFDMYYGQGLTVEQMMFFKNDYCWSTELISLRIQMLQVIRCVWEIGEIGFPYEP